ncbi:GAF domain-containing protein [Rhodococcus sp. ACPA1]|uniref:GAF domain-containing protein n=1 Tax=Rhodococcus sp. ACPA1 TaxID=2028572 RepID=UPI00211BF413|nr:GAF domain-containing protein [Rhodococcus sp. ACPA1]
MTADALELTHAEPTHPIREWTTVFVGTGDEHQVVAEGAKIREWRNINNVVRGPARTAVLGLIRQCIADRDLRIEPFDGKVADALGPVGAAHPILTPDKSVVVAVQVWTGDPKKNPPDRPNVGAWEWVLSSEDNPPPPQLQLDPGAIELIGMSARHQDRSVFGPADLYTRSARLSDTLRHVRQIRDCQVKDRFETAR